MFLLQEGVFHVWIGKNLMERNEDPEGSQDIKLDRKECISKLLENAMDQVQVPITPKTIMVTTSSVSEADFPLKQTSSSPYANQLEQKQNFTDWVKHLTVHGSLAFNRLNVQNLGIMEDDEKVYIQRFHSETWQEFSFRAAGILCDAFPITKKSDGSTDNIVLLMRMVMHC